jgi:hypothetical protein
MYSWPTNHTQTRKVTLHRKGNAKGKEKVDQPNYPVLDHGTLVAATLLENNDRLEWTQITRKASKGLTLSSNWLFVSSKQSQPI